MSCWPLIRRPRPLAAPRQQPAGVITALLGVPLFPLALLVLQRSSRSGAL